MAMLNRPNVAMKDSANCVWRIPARMAKATVESPQIRYGEVDELASNRIGIAFSESPDLVTGWAITTTIRYARNEVALAAMVEQTGGQGKRYHIHCNLYGADCLKVAELLNHLDELHASCVKVKEDVVEVQGYIGLHTRHDLTPPLARRRVDLAGIRHADSGGIMMLTRLMDSGYSLLNCPSHVAAMLWVATGRRP